MDISVIVPLLNEEESLPELCQWIERVMRENDYTYEILLIVVLGGIGSITGSILASFLFVASSEWWMRFLDEPMFIGGFQVPLLRTGFRMVVFSVVIMAVVLLWRKGIMGTREFSWDAIARFFKDPFGIVSKKKLKTGGVE